MSFNPLACKLAEEHRDLFDGRRVLDIGNQTVNVPDHPKYGDEIWRGASAGLVYRDLGAADYECVDSNDNHDATIVDLNDADSWPNAIPGYFDFIVNNGTGEHIFDQMSVFEGMHMYCKTGGHMLHILPCVNWINHGFYNYNPLLFYDLARANGYKVKGLTLANRFGFMIPINWDGGLGEQQIKPSTRGGLLMAAIHRVADNEIKHTGAIFPNVIVAALLQRVNKDAFNVPCQGKYIKDISSKSLRRAYEHGVQHPQGTGAK